MESRRNNKITIPVLEGNGEFGKVYRILFEVEAARYNLLELTMRKDGSLVLVYIIPSKSNSHKSKLLDISRRGVKTVKYTDMEDYDIHELKNPNKMTFHMSGIISSTPERLYRESLRTMNITQQLCAIIYPHTNMLVATARQKAYDFIAKSPVDESTHLLIRVLISPPDRIILNKFIDVGTFAVLQLRYKGEKIEHSTKELIVHVLIDRISAGNNPSSNIVLVPTLRDRLVPKELLHRMSS